MMGNWTFPENCDYVMGCIPTDSSSTVTAANISMKDALEVYIIVQLSNASGHAVVINPLLGAAVATCATAITFSAPYWYNVSALTTSVFTAGTAATTVTCNAAATPAIYVVKIDPVAALAQGATLDCLGCTITGGAHAADLASVYYLVVPRVAQITHPTILTD
jgi:hypothetical protein